VTQSQAPVNVSLPAGTPKAQYEFAFDLLRRGAYPQAEATLREFLQKNPKDPLAGNAQYWLGETYYVRNDFQQAAVEFMAGYQKYPKTAKAPDNLLKLGMSLSKLNQTDGACTALGRIGKDYPDAPADVAKLAKAERTRLKCKV
jgi:tol-pal system protein YbgF